ncbi:Tim44-like domain-containing protein [Halomonas sp. McH1-25]|uniref:Tim44 domain-containing protein n=1 Tax=unclassified Halomonas TaxID=2609666 RepID=UPI001EF4EFF1|nr:MULTISPECIES: Tim44-like domain-containing protein [unclassified Halomonas]MCG7601734.1 Tim44-like domain-containing protein [Halomonas sp. McH1-25]MCP1344559.1 Tim44-like domain-containing protein [Halomonas sp. FL8]MCP1360711.1 Tim44-like domain-containing protein [Halomonas sp. BBD45]MCP1364998.1 Tim44-like domain-containing protein [Halomonas sp. BBD48]
MRNLFVMLLVGLLGFGLAVEHAEAKRLGGGKSFGTYSRSANTTDAAPNRTATATPPRQPSQGLSRFAGPFAGLLAGGLLASLFFGGAFDELRLLDMLLIAGAIWLAFRLFRKKRQPAPAGGPQDYGHQPQARTDNSPQAFTASSLGGGAAAYPAWFDKERFLGGAKEHFTTLQRAWDNNDLSGIQEYVTPQLYNLLREERANQPANNRTEIVRLFAELGDVRETDRQAEATVLFHGIMDENGEQNEFNETWHLVRDLRDGAPWYIQGIEQNTAP